MNNQKDLFIVLAIVGFIGIVIFAFFSAMLLPALNMAKEKAKQADCTSKLKQIGVAAAQYAMSYDDMYPTSASTTKPNWLKGSSGKSFELLRKEDLLTDPKGYLCPGKKGITAAAWGQTLDGHVSYNWCDGLMGGSCTMSPVACDGTDNHSNTGRFLRGDGSVGTANGSKSKKWTQDGQFKDFCYNKTYTDFSF